MNLQTDEKGAEQSSVCHFFDAYGFPMTYIASEIAKLAGEIGAAHAVGNRFKMTVDVVGSHHQLSIFLPQALRLLPIDLLLSDNYFDGYANGRLIGHIYFIVQ